MNSTLVNGSEVEFYGQDMDLKLCEVRGLRIHPTHRENEADLLRSRWFDYQDMHPVHATYLFAHHYKQQTRKFVETYIDVRTAEDARAFVPDDIFLSRDLTGMWLARREADKHGLPYDFVMEHSMNVFIAKLFHRFPRPNQLYAEELYMDLTDLWRARLSREVIFSRKERFKVRSWCGDLAQARHVNFIVSQIKARPAPHIGLLARMFYEGVLSPSLVSSRFDQEVINLAKAQAARLG